ncbi:MAG: porin [Burkholderiaceae bacterium]|nr:porin [Burkholderiaceae bacterium]
MHPSTPRALLLGLALLAAGAAQAQGSVTLNGLFDASVGATKAPGGQTDRAVDSGKMTTSWFGLHGSEDLGGGVAAIFRMESFLRVDRGEAGRFGGDTFWARNAHVGLRSASLGTLTIGRNTTALFVSTLLFNAFGDSFGYSPAIRHYFTSGTVTGDTGWSDSISYSSPRWGGFGFGLATAVQEESSNGGNWSVNLGYSGGPFAASLVYQDVEKDGSSAVADTRTWQAGAKWNFGVLEAMAQYGTVKNDSTGNDYRIAGLGAKVPVGAGAVLAQWGRLDPKTGAERTTFSLGYDHFISKRTDLYAVAMSDKVDGLSSGHGWSLGVRHRF